MTWWRPSGSCASCFHFSRSRLSFFTHVLFLLQSHHIMRLIYRIKSSGCFWTFSRNFPVFLHLDEMQNQWNEEHDFAFC
jgi:hypothetical protein